VHTCILGRTHIKGHIELACLNSSTIYVPSHGLSIATMNVLDSRKRECVLQVFCTDNYTQSPSIHLIPIESTIKVINYSLSGPYHLRSHSLTDSITTTFSNLTVRLLPPLSFSEEFRDFWDVYGQAISLVGGGFAAGAAALFFNRLFKANK
jgi:hypothetical protein